MESPWGLTEATSWHSHDARLVHHFHTVDKVWGFTLLLCFLDELLREVESWETIHGTFNLSATHLIHIVECICQESSSFSEALHDLITLVVVFFDTCLGLSAKVWGINHKVYCQLSRSVRTKFY